MSEQTVYDYVKNTSKTIDNKDFEMLHQYALDKIRSCDFGPDYKYKCTTRYDTLNENSCIWFNGEGYKIDTFKTQKEFRDCVFGDMRNEMNRVTIQSFYEKVHLPLFAYEYIYDHILYPKLIHQYLKEHELTNNPYAYVTYKEDHGNHIIGTSDIQTETINHSDRYYEARWSVTYIPYHMLHKTRYNYVGNYNYNYELYDIYPLYVEPKHSKQDYINYFITNDFNCNRLRKLIIELTKLMLRRREECITQHVKQDDIINELQLLINYAQQMVIDCKEYLDKQMNDATVKLTF